MLIQTSLSCSYRYTVTGTQIVSAMSNSPHKGCSGDLGKESSGYAQLAAIPSCPLSCKGFEGKSLLLFLLCTQPTGTCGARLSNAQSRQVLLGLRGRKELQHLQLGDEEEEETHVKQLPATIQHEETNKITLLV